jgi:hypothetical protein
MSQASSSVAVVFYQSSSRIVLMSLKQVFGKLYGNLEQNNLGPSSYSSTYKSLVKCHFLFLGGLFWGQFGHFAETSEFIWIDRKLKRPLASSPPLKTSGHSCNKYWRTLPGVATVSQMIQVYLSGIRIPGDWRTAYSPRFVWSDPRSTCGLSQQKQIQCKPGLLGTNSACLQLDEEWRTQNLQFS